MKIRTSLVLSGLAIILVVTGCSQDNTSEVKTVDGDDEQVSGQGGLMTFTEDEVRQFNVRAFLEHRVGETDATWLVRVTPYVQQGWWPTSFSEIEYLEQQGYVQPSVDWKNNADILSKLESMKQADRSMRISDDAVYDIYTNGHLGFSMKIPKEMDFMYGGQCVWNEENGDHSYRPVNGSVPVSVFESDEYVYLAPMYYYELTGETVEDSRHFFTGCEKRDTTIADLESGKNGVAFNWKIVGREITNSSELTNFAKDMHGEGCSAGGQFESEQAGVYNVEIQSDGKDLETTQCALNGRSVMRYSPDKQKAFFWGMGQTMTFFINDTSAVDNEMEASFQIL